MFITFLFALLAFPAAVHAQLDDQSGFINIDCGLSNVSSTIDGPTGFNYTSDAGFIDTGVNKAIPASNYSESLWLTIRSFPEGRRNCYTLRPQNGKNNKYMIRARFLYGNYDGLNLPPRFDIYIGEDFWVTVIMPNSYNSLDFEILHTPSTDYIHVCLLKTGATNPFISALELRPINSSLYRTVSGSLALNGRFTFGAEFGMYAGDFYDRKWYTEWGGFTMPKDASLSTNQRISANDYQIPNEIMRTAATTNNSRDSLKISWTPQNETDQYYLYLHFAELENLTSGELRSFQIHFNGEPWSEELSPPYLRTRTVFSNASERVRSTYELSINSTESSTLPPIINAMELYRVINFTNSATVDSDVAAIFGIKSYYELKKNWQGDPCGPQAFRWEGLNCNYSNPNNYRIISLDISSSGLTGSIAPHIANLTSLETLDLSNNDLNGNVPGFLSQLPSLKILNLSGNSFSGPVPEELLRKSQQGLIFSIDESTLNDTGGKKNKVVIPVVASTVVTFLLACFVMITIYTIKRRRKAIEKQKENPYSLRDANWNITYSNILRITNNLERVLGKGGFGTVYHGKMDGIEVAVKMLNASSSQGQKEFQAEVNMLLNVHHKNLTSLVGYCNEDPHMGIIYEYMANGNLKHNLPELNWEGRLQVAIDTAQGLEYLHLGCKPPIIHRDIKPANILLDEKFKAKLADFGLSRAFSTESATHLSVNTIAGSPGYMDPEWHSCFKLTEKSDIFSFGVVLLEMITGKPVVDVNREKVHIKEWVVPFFESGEIRTIIDEKFQENINMNSAWKAFELAMRCVSTPSNTRPAMNEVVSELKACLAMETFDIEIETEPTSLTSTIDDDDDDGPEER